MPADAKASSESSATTQVLDGEEQRDDRRDRRLEDHRAGDVAHRQRVLALADPDDRVELLGQLGRDRRDDQGEQRARRRRAWSRGARPRRRRRRAPTMISPSAARTWRLTTRSRGTAGSSRWARAVEAVEAQRREVLGVDVGVGLEVALDVPGVDPDQDDRHDPLEPDRLERQEGGADGDARRRSRSSACRGRGRPCRRASRRPSGAAAPTHRTATPVTNMASVESMNGAPRIAPTPTSCDASPGREQDRDDRDHRLGQRRADRGQDRSDRALGELELAPEPLDAVGEQLGAEQDDDEARRRG